MLSESQPVFTPDARPEFAVLIVCARARMEDEAAAQLRTLLQGSLDWDYLLAAARRHKLTPLIYYHLNTICPELVPPERLAHLREHFRRNATRNLFTTGALGDLLKLFAAHAIPVIPYKGPALALTAYGDTALREFTDLDLLVKREDVARASAVLAAAGFTRRYQFAPREEAAYLAYACEHIFAHLEAGFYVELHWRFMPHYFPALCDPAQLWARAREVKLNQFTALTLAPEDMLLVLCLNAGKDNWQRLRTLTDIAAFIHAAPALDWATVLHRATATHTRRLLLASLWLIRDLLGVELLPEIAAQVSADHVATALAQRARQQLYQADVRPQHLFARAATHMALLERRRDKLNYWLRLALTPTAGDWAFAPLPDSLFSLYYLLRPVRLARDYARLRRAPRQ